MLYLNPILSERIDKKLRKLQKLRPLPSSAVKKLQEQFQIEMTYNSNAIEGNSLTLKETFLVINEGITIKGKPLKDHLETKDHHEALAFIYDLVKPQNRSTLSEVLICTLHKLVVKKTDEEWAGKYRNSDVIIAGADHRPPNATTIPLKMREMMNWFRDNQKKLHPITLASLLHHKLVYVHPFFDGNGRTARLIMNIILMAKGYPLAIVLKNDRQKYYRVLVQADKNNYEPLVHFISQTVERSLNIYLKILTPSSQKKEKLFFLSEISKKLPYNAKYLNLLARLGKLEAYKERRNWLTTLEAVQRYIQSRKRKRKI